MNWKKAGLAAGVIAGVFLGMKYVFPVMLPFLIGWILAEAVHPAAFYLASRKISKKLHFTEGGIGACIILLLTLACLGAVLAGADYLTCRVSECVKAFPRIKQEAQGIIQQCCVGVENMTGIPAEKSSTYLLKQMDSMGHYFWRNGKGVDTAVDSVKWCVLIVSMMIIGIVSSILFLQERDKIRRYMEKQSFYVKLRHVSREMAKGTKAYLKAQIKIMGVVCVLCIVGLWMLKVQHFVALGLGMGILDAFPVLGTGTFLIPAGILLLLQGSTVKGAGFFALYLVTAGVRQFLEPRLIGTHVGISPLLVLLSVYLGVIVYGGFGFLLGPLSGLLLYGIFKEWHLNET